ncbi:MAG: hypothetical protein HY606_04230 [Planctomycetes bacterium]|nr:hypothetical protein [Planctomycetota bacterium]
MDRRVDCCVWFHTCFDRLRRSKNQNLALFCLLLFVLNSCTTFSLGYIVDEIITDEETVFYKDVSLIKTDIPYYCGPESLKAIFDFLGVESSFEVIKDTIYNRKLKGTLPSTLVEYVRSKGLKIELKQDGNLALLAESLKKKVLPLIIVQFRQDVRHFLVINGINVKMRFVICADYNARYRVISFDELIKIWSDAKFLQFVISLQSEYESVLEKAFIFESNGAYEKATDLYKKAIQLDENNYVSYLGLANCYYGLNNKDAALINYSKSYQLYKSDPLLLNNYASVLLELDKDIDFGLELVTKAVEESEKLYSNELEEANRQKFLFRWISCIATLGEYREHFKEYAGALACYVKSYDLTPPQYVKDRDRKIVKIVNCYKALGKLGSAREWEKKLSAGK